MLFLVTVPQSGNTKEDVLHCDYEYDGEPQAVGSRDAAIITVKTVLRHILVFTQQLRLGRSAEIGKHEYRISSVKSLVCNNVHGRGQYEQIKVGPKYF